MRLVGLCVDRKMIPLAKKLPVFPEDGSLPGDAAQNRLVLECLPPDRISRDLSANFVHPGEFKAVYKGESLTHLFGESRPKDGKTRMNKSAAKKMKQRSAGKPDIELGKRIRLRRVEQKISQAELGEELGVSFQQVQKYEKGVNRVGAARLQQIATALDVPVTFFYDGDGKAREVESLLFLDSAFSLRLLRAYSKIKDQTVQRQLVSLMESIAANES